MNKDYSLSPRFVRFLKTVIALGLAIITFSAATGWQLN